jgi:hypothetical protein
MYYPDFIPAFFWSAPTGSTDPVKDGGGSHGLITAKHNMKEKTRAEPS